MPKPGGVPTPLPGSEWIALRVEAPYDVADAVANFLLEAGVPGIVTEERATGVALEAALPADRHADALAALDRYLLSLADVAPAARRATVHIAPVPAVDWDEVARRHHRPREVGARLLVAPPWDVPAASGREVLVIEPGMAFGTGGHATTRGCLEAIERVLAETTVRSALDVGTGSGILALALARLGVQRVVALDTDVSVLPIARANLVANAAARVSVLAGSMGAVRWRFDLVVANLLADAIAAEAPSLDAAVSGGGRLVVSGILAAQVPDVLRAYPGWTVTDTRAEDDWATLTLARAV